MEITMAIKKILAVVFSAIALSACNKTDSIKVAGSIDDDFSSAYQALESSRTPTSKVSGDTVSASEGVWLGSRSVVMPHRNDLPSKFETESGVTIVMDEPVSLQTLLNKIHDITGINATIDGQVNSEKLAKTIMVSHSGKLSDLLSKVATDLDLLWYYDKENIVFYETETKTFNLYALGTDISYTSKIQSDDANQVSLESNLREWDEVEKAITSILDGVSNAKFTVSKSLGTITVTASPSVLTRVGEYIAKQNKRLSQQVAIDVKVLQVSISNSNAMGLNLGAAIQSATGLQLVSSQQKTLSADASAAANNLSLAVLSNTVAGGTKYSDAQIAKSPYSMASGSAALIQALAKQGKISLVTSATVTTRNNRVAPVSNTKTTGYIKRFESRTFTSTEASTVDQDNLETGFSMQLLPNILDGGKVLLMFKMSVRELIKMATQEIGSVTIQLPEVEERSFMQEVIMESGQMLVLTGFEKQSNNDTRYGTGEADFMALGGSRETTSQRDVLVVMLTPQVLVSPMDSERAIMRDWGAPLN
jgi:hypothetical protein